ncbi:eukaryotic release factor 3 [Perkinsela sp. CCAP 1560/4]|nr:eukaryotic release factor 3 [Perkinsela sp. CCAP 1560/4]|eukprot:KNH06227.1 eukaryotic release factor 3 [Perkinsela sp. CCAP 1560/4]
MTDTELAGTTETLDALTLNAGTTEKFQRDKRPHLSIVFCGHVDAGKSTCSGHILFITGNVDERTMEKNKREAIRKHRDGWEFAYVMDVTEDERDRGKTHEMGSAYFETDAKRYTILDAPGHKCFVSSMIGGASQADVAILVISSRRGEFETGFEGNGQTREHALLLRTCGVGHLIVAINKLDDPSVNWSEERYADIRSKLIPFLKTIGYVEGKNCVFMPISGITGAGLKSPVPADLVGKYYTGPSLLGYLDGLANVKRSADPNIRFLVQGAYRDDGKLTVYGKLESGELSKGEKLLIMPTRREVLVDSILLGEFVVEDAEPGDFLHLRFKQSEEEELHPGYVLCKPGMPLKAVHYFQAQIMISDKPLVSNGFECMLHIHNAECEVSVDRILAKVDRKTNKVLAKDPGFARNGESVIARMKTIGQPVVVELYKDFEKLGRLNLREEGKTIAFGVVTKIYEKQTVS